jgi:uncharacterized protein involved in exopolysaccharide biosynthesis
MLRSSLKDILNYLWLERKLVIKGTVFCAIISTLVSLCLPNIYQAKAMVYLVSPELRTEFIPKEVAVNINQGVNQQQPLADFRGLIEERGIFSLVIKEISKSPQILKELKERLNLKYVIEDLDKKILKAEVLEYSSAFATRGYTPLISLTAKAKDKKLVKELANLWAEILKQKVEELSTFKLNETYRFILEKLENLKKELSDKEKMLKDLEITSILEMELKAKEEGFLNYSNELNNLRLSKDIDKTKEGYLLDILDKTKKEILELKGEIYEKKNQLSQIQRDIDILKMNFNLLEQKKTQLEISRVERPEELKIIAQAVEPQKHIQPKRVLIVSISTIFGLIMICLWVLLKSSK